MEIAGLHARSGAAPPLAARWKGVARLLRPANLVTSAADVLTSSAVAGLSASRLVWPLLASLCLYGGGIVLNDFFDRTLDAVERPERPIPSGVVPAGFAAVLGFGLLACGVVLGFAASIATGGVAVTLAACILLYDAGGKHLAIGPIVMGSCRALNLLLGLAAVPAMLTGHWQLALLPLVYICGVTLLSRGEVHGGSATISGVSLALFAAVCVCVPVLEAGGARYVWSSIPFLVLLVLRAGVPLWRAFERPDAGQVRAAVHAGVVSLIVLDAAVAAGYAGVVCGAAILSLSVLAGELAKLFPVT
jgi:4-hydroxybenzoate polyprenyltransferase